MAGFGGGFDTGAGFGGGGGFVADNTQTQGGYGYGTAPSSGGGGSGSDVKRGDTLQPVTIAQLNAASSDADSKFSVNGQQLGMVTFVARITACEPRVTMIQLQLDDCSGSLGASYMVDPEMNEYSMQKREHIKDGAWVRIAGMAKTQNGEVGVDAIQVKAVEDFNEITYHKLEVVRAFLGQTKSRPAAASGTTPVRQGMSKVGIGAAGAPGAAPVPYGGYGGGGGGGAAPAPDAGYGGMAKDVSAVYEYLRQRYEPENQDGVHVSEIARNVPEAKDDATVRKLLDVLASEGHVYSTVDDDHYTYCQA